MQLLEPLYCVLWKMLTRLWKVIKLLKLNFLVPARTIYFLFSHPWKPYHIWAAPTIYSYHPFLFSATFEGTTPSCNCQYLLKIEQPLLPFSKRAIKWCVRVLLTNSFLLFVISEIKRVLRPGGLYLFVEHVAAKGSVRGWNSKFIDDTKGCAGC